MFQRPSSRHTLLACSLCLVAPSFCAHAAPAIPPDALTAVQQVNSAAARKDFGTLEALMTPQFIWSYSGDANAKQAIAEWQSHPKFLKDLQRVTSLPCVQTSALVECSAKVKGGFRAGFKQTSTGWRMVYFVEGE
jgi:hypothetical protein